MAQTVAPRETAAAAAPPSPAPPIASLPDTDVRVLRCPRCGIALAVEHLGVQVIKHDGRVFVGVMGVVQCPRNRKCGGEWTGDDSEIVQRSTAALAAMTDYLPRRVTAR